MNKSRLFFSGKVIILVLFIALIVILKPYIFSTVENNSRKVESQTKTRNIQVNFQSDDKSAFGIYEDLRGKIQSHKAGAKDIDGFRRVITDDNEIDGIIKTLGIPKSMRDTEYYERLYSQFIQASPNSDVLYDYLKIELLNILKKADKNDTLRANIYAWQWAYGAQAAVLAYTATNDERFLDLIVSTYDVILKFRDSERNRPDVVRNRILHSWGTGRPPSEVKIDKKGWWSNAVTHTGRITYPVSSFCKVVFDDKRLHVKYLKKAQYYLQSVEDAVREFDKDFKVISDAGEGYYLNPISGRVEPLNHAHSMGNTLVMLYSISGNEEYRSKAEKLAKYFLSSVKTEENGSYVWVYNPVPDDRYTRTREYVWKGQITISFPVLAYSHGIAFDSKDMTALTKTFLEDIYIEKCSFNSIISTKKKTLSSFKKKYEHEGIIAWIILDKYNPEIRRIIETSVAECPDLYPKGWFSNVKTALAYSYRLNNGQRI